MATAQQTAAKPPYEAAVDQQLGRVRQRIRGMDISFWSAGLCSTILAYGLALSFVDRMWDLSQPIRFAAWCVFVVALAAYLVVAVRRVVLGKLNPQFLARRLEQTIPDAKNSVINWLDLRDQSLPPVIRGSLGRRAAKDLAQADAERAVSARPLWWLGCIALTLLVVQLAWLMTAPAQVTSLLQRAFFPFDTSKIAAQTQLTLLKPEGGNVAVPPNHAVQFRVQAQGYLPPLNQKDSLRLHFRYHQNEPFEERLLARDLDGNWTTIVLADLVRGGFWYKITGGDAVLPEDGEYRVEVRANPQVLRFEAQFKYRDYLRAKDKTVVFDKTQRPKIREICGTELTLTVRTNRALEDCLLRLKTSSALKHNEGEAVPDDPEAWRFKFVLDESAEFRIQFHSKDGEKNVDQQAYKIEVVPDRAPVVLMTKPAQDIALPANGTLLVQGFAMDDFGVKSMQLMLKPIKPANLPHLQPKVYRPNVKFELVNGKYPRRLDYTDFIQLGSLQTTEGKPFPLSAGMELEYWLEARDNCDYPNKDGNLGQSKKFKITITPPESDKNKAGQDQKAAEQQTQQDHKQQDKSLDQQNMQAKAEDQAGNGASGGGGGKGENKDESKDLQQQAQDVNNALDKQNKPGSAKGSGDQDGQPKDQPGEKPNPKPGAGNQPPGDKKDDPKADNNPSKGKDGPGDKKDSPGEAKDKKDDKADAGQSKGAGADKGTDKGGDQSKGEQKKGDNAAKGGSQGAAKDDGSKKAGAGEPATKPGQIDDKNAAAKAPDPSKDVTGKPGDESKNPMASAKPAPKDGPTTQEQIANAKGGKPTDETPPADAKFGPPEPLQSPGNAKPQDRKEATQADVEKLREQLMNDPDARDKAQKALEKIGDQANDPKVQQAAEKALQDAKSQPGLAKNNDAQGGAPIPPSGSKAPGSAADPKDAGAATAKAAPPKDSGAAKAGDGPGKTGSSVKNELTKPGAGNPGIADKDVSGQYDPPKPAPVDEEAAGRASDLQLESLKKQIDKLRDKLTPKVLNELNWTEKDREDFLRKMMADALLRQEQGKVIGDKMPAPGAINSLLPSTGPRLIERDPRANPGSITNDQALPPPEVREALKIFQQQKK